MIRHLNYAAIFAAFVVMLATPSECKNQEHNPANQANGRRREKLEWASHRAAAADCGASMDIKLYADSPGYHHFKPDMKACKSGRAYVGSTEDGNCHVTLVPSSAGNGKNEAFAASVTCDDTGVVYSIGMDGDGAMVVEERMQEDYGPEIDPRDEISADERALLEARLATPPGALSTTSGLRGKVADQLRDLGDRFLAENHGDHADHRDLQTDVQIDVLVLYTAHAECRNAGLARGCARTDSTKTSMLNRINLAVSETNVAYDLSGINANLNLVHVAFDTYVEAATNAFDTALSNLRTNNDGKLDQAHPLRTTYGADVVALIIDDAQYCGIAYLGPSIDYMFSVTAWNCATGYYSFGHEIGHNFGCNHDRGTSNACANTNYNYGYRDPQARFRSILAYSCATGQCDANAGGGACTRVQRFSNNYAGTSVYNGLGPIGTAQNDNARKTNDVAQTVANYFPTVPVASPTTKSPTRSPTFSPTSSPSTARPTVAPTTSQPTISDSPTGVPTTSQPTTSPTDSPTRVPTTSKPTDSPTTGSPTTSTPTKTPTTSTPTKTPTTRAPTCIATGQPCSSGALCCSGQCKPNNRCR